MINHTTSVFILGILAVIFIYDTLAALVNKHATISETTTTYIQLHPVVKVLVILGIGILIGHLFFSVTYC